MCSLCSVRLILCLFLGLMSFSTGAQIQPAWVARYNNGISNGTHQAVKMALDPSGNIYIAGFSQNSNSQLGYITIKYAPTGKQLWATRYDSTSYPGATPAAFVVDTSNNVIVTGSALTVKYDSSGNQIWTAPYAGTGVAADKNGNIYITGFDTNFSTLKLTLAGTNVWMVSTHSIYGPNLSEAVAVDAVGNVYVSGYTTYDQNSDGYFINVTTVSYNASGSVLWHSDSYQNALASSLKIEGVGFDNATNYYILADLFSSRGDPTPRYLTLKYAGSNGWGISDPTDNAASLSHGLVLDGANNLLVTGQIHGDDDQNYVYGTYKIGTNGTYTWGTNYPQTPYGPITASSAAMSIAVDSANSCYVTGYSPGTNSGNDIVTIKYDQNGNQIWLQRYHGPGNGDDAGNAIAVDNNGNVYVTGYETTAAGGTEIVTIKYSPVSVQRRSDGTILLQAQGSPGQNFDVQASSDLQTWQDLGDVTADTNGLAQYDDTNAPNFDWRFYVTVPQ